jgi:allantoinase
MSPDRSIPRATRAVVGGRLVTESAIFDATILIDEFGQIRALTDPDMPVSAEDVLDASGLLVFPGGIDTHSHLNDPGLTESEDFETGTRGAAAGGYTTVLEMPQTLPLVDSIETFQHKLETVTPKAVVDFGLYCALVPDNCGDVEALQAIAMAGAIALKGFVCDTPEMPTLSDSQLAEGMRNATRLGLPVAVHCESQPVIDLNIERLKRERATEVYQIAEAHPLKAEQDAVRAALDVAKMSGGKLHLVHMSDPSTVKLAFAAKVAGADVSIETCPHYLAFTKAKLKEASGWALCFPPFRTPASVEGLWRALQLGLIDAIGSDHCAYTLEQKETTDPWQVLPGINGIQVALPVLVDGALRRQVPLTAVARAFSSNPARRFSLHPRKGDIRPGADADLVFVDVNSSITARAEDFFTRCPRTVYEGMIFGARVRRTMVRGVTVYGDEGEPRIAVDAGFGAFLHGDVARTSQGEEVTRRSAPSTSLAPS